MACWKIMENWQLMFPLDSRPRWNLHRLQGFSTFYSHVSQIFDTRMVGSWGAHVLVEPVIPTHVATLVIPTWSFGKQVVRPSSLWNLHNYSAIFANIPLANAYHVMQIKSVVHFWQQKSVLNSRKTKYARLNAWKQLDLGIPSIDNWLLFRFV